MGCLNSLSSCRLHTGDTRKCKESSATLPSTLPLKARVFLNPQMFDKWKFISLTSAKGAVVKVTPLYSAWQRTPLLYFLTLSSFQKASADLLSTSNLAYPPQGDRELHTKCSEHSNFSGLGLKAQQKPKAKFQNQVPLLKLWVPPLTRLQGKGYPHVSVFEDSAEISKLVFKRAEKAKQTTQSSLLLNTRLHLWPSKLVLR